MKVKDSSKKVRPKKQWTLSFEPIPKTGPYVSVDRINWERVDWSRSDEELARTLNVQVGTIRRKRKQHSETFEPINPYHRYDWREVDWSQTNASIARKLGCAEQSVAYRRKKLKKAKESSLRSSKGG